MSREQDTILMFKNILLEPDQENLLMSLVEAKRNTQPNNRQYFVFYDYEPAGDIHHTGLQKGFMSAHVTDMEILERERLLLFLERSSDVITFDVAPRGTKYYEYLKTETSQPLQRVEQEIRSYLVSDEL